MSHPSLSASLVGAAARAWARTLVASLALALSAAAAGAQQVPLPGASIPKFVDPVPQPARLNGTNTSPANPIVVRLEEFQQKVLPAQMYAGLGAPWKSGTYVWSYVIPGRPRTYPGATIEARRGRPTTVKFINNLQGPGGSAPFLQSLITVDQTMHWADPLGQHGATTAYVGPVPAVAHLHGAETPSSTDGGPDAWWTPGFAHKGPGFVTDTYTYPNSQEATMLWYHDHTLGATRTTVYAGLAAAYMLRDPGNEPLNLPGGPFDRGSDRYGNDFERELILQDRMFDTNGQLLFPAEGVNPEIHPFWVPEFFGDVIVVNGKSWPYMNVEPRRYRFRLVNGSNARFYELHLNDPRPGATEPRIWQIGTDGGLLDAPVALNGGATPLPLVIAPGERMDLIIDFAGLAGQRIVMTNLANGPYPDGDPVDPATTGQIMQFRVGRTITGGFDTSLNPARTTRLRRSAIERPAAPAQPTRALTLNEQMGDNGPIAGFVNNTMWEHAASENLTVGDTEVWEIINLTGDTHPVHLHLVQFQVLSRQDFDVDGYMGVYGMPMEGMGPPLPYGEKSAATGFKLGGNPDVTPFLLGSPMPVDDNENGWKDTFRMNPGQVTRVLVRVAPQDANRQSGGTLTAGMNLFDFDPTAGMDVANDGFGYHGGPGYVWHCHILDHEDNDMMRPMLITKAAPAVGASAGPVAGAARPAVQLAAARPNPAIGAARIAFTLEDAKDVELTVYDLAGREVATLAQGRFAAGEHVVNWNGVDRAGRVVPSGAYLYRLRTGAESHVRKLVFVR